jgi:hypothetical protein
MPPFNDPPHSLSLPANPSSGRSTSALLTRLMNDSYALRPTRPVILTLAVQAERHHRHLRFDRQALAGRRQPCLIRIGPRGLFAGSCFRRSSTNTSRVALSCTGTEPRETKLGLLPVHVHFTFPLLRLAIHEPIELGTDEAIALPTCRIEVDFESVGDPLAGVAEGGALD